MRERQIISSINDSQLFLKNLNILREFSFPSLLKPNKLKYKINSIESPKYEELFLFSLENQYYNIILNDYSYFQFDFDEEEDRKNRYIYPSARYAFYPNPFENINDDIGAIQQLYDEGEIDFEEYSQAMSEAKPLGKKIPVRYDLSFKQYREIYHPVSHFHFGMAENSRIPTDKLFTPLLFTKFIVNMYYMQELENIDDGTFPLHNEFKSKINSCKKINEYNNERVKYISHLEEEILAIK